MTAPIIGVGPDWPETTCYLDLWIELLHDWNLPIEPVLSYAASVAWEGDQFTFGRPAHDDLAGLHGVTVHELTIYRPIADHIRVQQAAGSTVIIEVDAFYLPDTTGATYRAHHEKTTMVVTGFDGHTLDYIHNRSRGQLVGDDLQGVLAQWSLPPFTEIARREGPAVQGTALHQAVRAGLRARLARRPNANAVAGFRAALESDGAALASGALLFHPYAFNTYRMLGTTFQSLGQLAGWLGDGLGPVVVACAAGSAAAKTEQFRAARATARGRAPVPGPALDDAEAAWDAVFQGLRAAYA